MMHPDTLSAFIAAKRKALHAETVVLFKCVVNVKIIHQ